MALSRTAISLGSGAEAETREERVGVAQDLGRRRGERVVAVPEALVRERGQQHAAGVAIDCAHLLTTAGRG